MPVAYRRTLRIRLLGETERSILRSTIGLSCRDLPRRDALASAAASTATGPHRRVDQIREQVVFEVALREVPPRPHEDVERSERHGLTGRAVDRDALQLRVVDTHVARVVLGSQLDQMRFVSRGENERRCRGLYRQGAARIPTLPDA